MHALARDPKFRPASAAELGQELGGSAEQPTRPLPQQRIPARQRWWLWLAGAVAAGAVALILGLAKLGGDGQSPPPAPPQIAPPAPASTAAQQARNLARWLRAHSG
jgi:hypothetical protein